MDESTEDNQLDSLKEQHKLFVQSNYSFPQDNLPASVFHYTSINALRSILENKSFWISNAEFLNDSQEINYTKKLINSLADKFVDPWFFKDTVDSIVNEMVPDKIHNLFLLSLTKNRDSLALWSSYSNFDGYNIEFSLTEILKYFNNYVITLTDKTIVNPDDKLIMTYGNVIYSEEKQKQFIMNILNMVNQYYFVDPKNSYFSEYQDYLYNQFFESIAASLARASIFFKPVIFEQEEEFRIAFIIKSSDFRKNVTKYRTSNGSFIPYIEISNPNCTLPLKSVRIGPKNYCDIAKQGVELFLESLNYKDVSVIPSGLTLRY